MTVARLTSFQYAREQKNLKQQSPLCLQTVPGCVSRGFTTFVRRTVAGQVARAIAFA